MHFFFVPLSLLTSLIPSFLLRAPRSSCWPGGYNLVPMKITNGKEWWWFDVGAFWLDGVWAQAPTQWASSTPLALHSHHALGNTPQSSGLEAKGVMKVSTQIKSKKHINLCPLQRALFIQSKCSKLRYKKGKVLSTKPYPTYTLASTYCVPHHNSIKESSNRLSYKHTHTHTHTHIHFLSLSLSLT